MMDWEKFFGLFAVASLAALVGWFGGRVDVSTDPEAAARTARFATEARGQRIAEECVQLCAGASRSDASLPVLRIEIDLVVGGAHCWCGR